MGLRASHAKSSCFFCTFLYVAKQWHIDKLLYRYDVAHQHGTGQPLALYTCVAVPFAFIHALPYTCVVRLHLYMRHYSICVIHLSPYTCVIHLRLYMRRRSICVYACITAPFALSNKGETFVCTCTCRCTTSTQYWPAPSAIYVNIRHLFPSYQAFAPHPLFSQTVFEPSFIPPSHTPIPHPHPIPSSPTALQCR